MQCFIAAPAFGANTVILDQIRDHENVGSIAYIFEDEHAQLTLEQVLETGRAHRWKPSQVEVPNFGLSDSAYWLRFDITVETFTSQVWVLEVGYQYLDSIDFYVVDGGGEADLLRAGDLLPFDERVLLHHNFVFPLDLSAGETRSILLRVQSSSTLQIPLTIYTADALRQSERGFRLGIGVFYGIILVTFFYNLFIYILNRDPSHIFYLLYVLNLGWAGACANGIWAEWIVPQSPYWVNRGLLIALTLLCLFGNLFTYSFLQMRKRIPSLARVSLGVSWGAVSIGLGALVFPYGSIIIWLVCLGSFLVFLWITAGVLVFKQGYHPAGYYLASWGVLLVGMIALLMKTVGWLPSNFFTTYSLQLSTAAEVVLLSFALADRIRVLRVEKEDALAEKLFSAHIMNRYLPPQLVEELMAKELSMDEPAHSRHITVLFADLAGFTSTCEQFGAQVITELLNDYLTTMSDVIFEHGGTIDKFIGDAVMVIFGAPKSMSPDEQRQRAVDCALAMQREMAGFQERSQVRGQPQLHMRIGIHQGPAVVGNFGSDKRVDYTCIGHTVNIASRIETACEPGAVFVSGAVAEGLTQETIAAGTFDLKGVQKKKPLFKVMA